MTVRLARRTWPVVETFGPTIQGEGPLAGVPCSFVRFGGCDYRCTWCDSLHAVDPAQWGRTARRLDAGQIVDELEAVERNARRRPRWVVLSGGNPALYDMAALVSELHRSRRFVAVETQGTAWASWLRDVDALVVSPKPPSSGISVEDSRAAFERFLVESRGWRRARQARACKVVVADERDLAFAIDAFHAVRVERVVEATTIAGVPIEDDFEMVPRPTGALLDGDWSLHLSALTPQRPTGDTDSSQMQTLLDVSDSYRRLCEMVTDRAALFAKLGNVHVQPQLHVIAWGAAQGV